MTQNIRSSDDKRRQEKTSDMSEEAAHNNKWRGELTRVVDPAAAVVLQRAGETGVLLADRVERLGGDRGGDAVGGNAAQAGVALELLERSEELLRVAAVVELHDTIPPASAPRI